ncbi:MAG: hypothetical protein WC869_05130 [Phycisphaerae bacterium]|jgi:hypothetical protein
MTEFCQDIDLLAIEPRIFLTATPPGITLAQGTGGTLAGTSLLAETAGFVEAGVEAGMVLVVHSGNSAEGQAYEIVTVNGPTQLTVSALRAERGQPLIPPSMASGASFCVRTFKPQIHLVCEALAEKLRRMMEASPVTSANFEDSAQLRQAAAIGTLGTLFFALAESAAPSDPNWAKAECYRSQFAQLQSRLRLAIDLDGDGVAEETRTLGHITLRRI